MTLDMLPIPKADELLYSVFARFAWRLQLPNRKHVMDLLFGKATGTSVRDLPTMLGTFQSRVPPAHPLSRSNLPEEFTLFPVYAPFMEPERSNQLVADMNGDGGTRASLRAGIMAHQISRKGLQACPKCIAEDLRSDGEPFWRRAHQVHGVIVCDVHKTLLVDTGVAGPLRVNRQEYLMPADSIGSLVPKELSPDRREHQDSLRIAEYAQMVLAQREWRMPAISWQHLYRRCLLERSYAYGDQYCQASRLISDFNSRFPPEFLGQIGCTTPSKATDSWLAHLIRRPRVSRPALQHFLFWLFLDLKPAEILPLTRTTVAPSVTIAVSANVLNRPERSPEWKERVRCLWENTKLSLRAIARDLKVDPITVKRHAVKLGLHFPRGFVRPTTTAGVTLMIQRSQERLACLPRRKQKWLKLQATHPNLGAKKLRCLNPAHYAALHRADRNWLKSHQPTTKRTRAASRVDWRERDDELREKLKTAFIRLTVSPDRPKQITIAALGRKAASRAWLEKHLDKLPKCRRYIMGVVEDRIQYALRRLGYAAARGQTDGIVPVAWRLHRDAGIRPDLARNKIIRDYVEDLLLNKPLFIKPGAGHRIHFDSGHGTSPSGFRNYLPTNSNHLRPRRS